MSRRTISIGHSRDHLPQRCCACHYWQMGSDEKDDASVNLSGWISRVSREWGAHGRSLQEDGVTVGFIQVAPVKYFPRACTYPWRVSSDAVFLSCIYVCPEARGRGVGKALVQAALAELARRKSRAVETFATVRGEDGAAAPGDDEAGAPGNKHAGAPVDFWLKNGFYVHRDHPKHPLMRLDVESTKSWQESLGSILSRVGTPAPAPAPKPG